MPSTIWSRIAHDRVERVHRALGDQRDLAQPDLPHLLLVERQQVGAVEHDLAAARSGPGGLISRSSASAIVVLPEPDSPTSPKRSPGARLKETPSTAFTGPRGVW